MIIAERHYWRTADGRLVPTGHPDGEVLAYTKGDTIPDEVAKELGLIKDPDKDADKPKQAPAPANKARTKPADK